MIGLAKFLLRNERGAATIELAIAAPILTALIIGTVQLSEAYSTKLELEQAAQATVERIQQSGFDSTKLAAYKTEAATAASVATTAVTIDYWTECNGTRQGSFSTACAAGQVYAKYMNVDITKSFTPMFSTKLTGADTNGAYTLHGIAGIRFL
ncbi:MAG: TadE/TadG family type IV pilus assembly protein [Sphingomicrobium sp.]